MLSSRNKDPIPDGNGGAVALGAVREQLKDELEHDRLYGHQILEVWINEDAGAENGSADIWNHCMERMDQADIVVVIYNGEAGWGTADGEVGICHGEMSWVLGRSTRVALKLMFDWITQSGELSRIATRGRSRRVILEAVAREIQKASQAQVR